MFSPRFVLWFLIWHGLLLSVKEARLRKVGWGGGKVREINKMLKRKKRIAVGGSQIISRRAEVMNEKIFLRTFLLSSWLEEQTTVFQESFLGILKANFCHQG